MKELLQKEQILAVCWAAVSLGIIWFKITGGEPLVRKDCVWIISEIKSLNGVESVTLTTNGILLEEQAEALKRAGIDCINVSLDSLNSRLYRQITDQAALEKVLAGIRQAEKLDSPVHVNTVLPCLCYGESIDGGRSCGRQIMSRSVSCCSV